MRKKLSLILLSMVIGFSVILAGVLVISPVSAREARVIEMKYKTAIETDVVVRVGSGTLYLISGYASTGSAYYSVHDSATVIDCIPNTTMAEGGAGTQYNSVPTLDFGKEGIPFTQGLVIKATNASISVQYK